MQTKDKKENLFPTEFFKQFKNKDSFQDYFNSIFKQENAVFKAIYLSIKKIEASWNRPIANWGLVLNKYLIIFEINAGHKFCLHYLVYTLIK